MNVYDKISANNRKIAALLCAFPPLLFVYIFLLSLPLVRITSPVITAWRQIMDFIFAAARVHGRYHEFHGRPGGAGAPEPLGDFNFSPGVIASYPSQALDFTLAVYPWIIGAIFIWILVTYCGGGSMILRKARARSVTPAENHELFRLVENTAIMAGLPTPKIYLTRDLSMNAFATGCSPETASIALTDGIVKKLDKAELQAVVAHELAHIGNRDTRLMVITITGIGFFTFFGEGLRNILTGSEGRPATMSLDPIIPILSAMLGAVFLFFGYAVAPLLRFALSRRSEYQADATAVKITRDPGALARALSKIAEDPTVATFTACPLAANVCIASPALAEGFANFKNRLYSTHPPIEDRIAVLEKMAADTGPPEASPEGRGVW